ELASCPHTPESYGVWCVEGTTYLLQEYVEGVDLHDLLYGSRLVENVVRDLFRQLLEALSAFKRHGLAHRDLKPDNILVRAVDGGLKVVDFGLAGNGWSGDGLAGCPDYQAPEVILGGRYDGPASDMWSAGLILYEVLHQRQPHDFDGMRWDPNDRQLFFWWLFRADLSADPGIDRDAADLIRKMLVVDPEHRISAVDALAHPFLSLTPLPPPTPTPPPTPPAPDLRSHLEAAKRTVKRLKGKVEKLEERGRKLEEKGEELEEKVGRLIGQLKGERARARKMAKTGREDLVSLKRERDVLIRRQHIREEAPPTRPRPLDGGRSGKKGGLLKGLKALGRKIKGWARGARVSPKPE
ncbi:hypothetical protein HK097_004159, partial [Rhizophlyctis rosea]